MHTIPIVPSSKICIVQTRAMHSAFDASGSRESLQMAMDSKPDMSREYTVADLLRKIDPSATIDPLAEEFVLDIVDDFIDSVVGLAADCARNRGSQSVQPDDIAYVVQRKFGDIGLGAPQGIQRQPEFVGNEAHARRMKAIEEARQRAAAPAAGP